MYHYHSSSKLSEIPVSKQKKRTQYKTLNPKPKKNKSHPPNQPFTQVPLQTTYKATITAITAATPSTATPPFTEGPTAAAPWKGENRVGSTPEGRAEGVAPEACGPNATDEEAAPPINPCSRSAGVDEAAATEAKLLDAGTSTEICETWSGFSTTGVLLQLQSERVLVT